MGTVRFHNRRCRLLKSEKLVTSLITDDCSLRGAHGYVGKGSFSDMRKCQRDVRSYQ